MDLLVEFTAAPLVHQPALGMPNSFASPRGAFAVTSSPQSNAYVNDASICAEIESVDGLLNNLLCAPSVDAHTGENLSLATLAEEANAERTLRVECRELQSALAGARDEVEIRRSALERSLCTARDEVGRLRAERSVMEAEHECRRHQQDNCQAQSIEVLATVESRNRLCEEEAAGARCEVRESQAEAAAARRELLECQSFCQRELARCGSVHMRELGDLQQQVRMLELELRARWAAVESDLSQSPADRSTRNALLPVASAPGTDIESAVLDLCERLEHDAMELPLPRTAILDTSPMRRLNMSR